MKAVVYHADGPIAEKFPKGTYRKLFYGLHMNLNEMGIELIHLTTMGHEGWGDKTYWFRGKPEHIVWNREKFWIEFLKEHAEDGETYWCCEPDSRLKAEIPPLTGDLAILRRNDAVAITPSWRLSKRSALPFFEEVFTYYDPEHKDWNGDSTGWIKMWEKMGSPGMGKIKYNGMNIELRDYNLYSTKDSRYTTQHKAQNKLSLI
jgi:hypothetical protein